jgi:hypothetical protein
MRFFQIARPQRRGRTPDLPFTAALTTPQIDVHAVDIGGVGTGPVGEPGRGATVRTCAREARQLSQVLRHRGLSTRRLVFAATGAFDVTATFFAMTTGICSKCVAGLRIGGAFFMKTQ